MPDGPRAAGPVVTLEWKVKSLENGLPEDSPCKSLWWLFLVAVALGHRALL